MHESGAFLEPDDWIGRSLLGRYDVLGLLATGGMGRVYRGVQLSLDRPVAIKRIHPHLVLAPGVVERFLLEARVVSGLAHENVVRVFDFGQTPRARQTPETSRTPQAARTPQIRREHGGDVFLVMELLEGSDLATTLASGASPSLAWTVDILLQVLRALEEIHASGITHRDIKPENVFLTRTRRGRDLVRIIDFGVAKMSEVSSRSSLHEMVGTPEYMSPELIRGEPVDASADLYAAGVILHRLLTGRLLFDAGTVPEVLHLQLTAPRPDPRSLVPALPRALAEFCSKAVALEKPARFQSAAEMAGQLSNLRTELGLDETPSGRGRRITAPLPGPPSSRYTFIDKRTNFGALEKLDRRISEALARGDREEACRGLEDGVARAELAYAQGDVDLAALAWASFGGRLADEWRCQGRHAEAAALLRRGLERVGSDEFAGARLCEALDRLAGNR
jgi:serine/threonine protein kinase